jgi:hypothetical protein
MLSNSSGGRLLSTGVLRKPSTDAPYRVVGSGKTIIHLRQTKNENITDQSDETLVNPLDKQT